MTDKSASRSATISRTTSETDIRLSLTLGMLGKLTGGTGIGFFDHMLTLFARHGGMDLSIECVGDLHVDAHHTVEDTAICLGKALQQALGDKRGISRYGTAYVPMDECLARAVIDLSGRTYFALDAPVESEKIGDFDTELAWEFFATFSRAGAMNLHLDLIRSGNAHHSVEACFKAVARAVRTAVAVDDSDDTVPSTKGTIGD